MMHITIEGILILWAESSPFLLFQHLVVWGIYFLPQYNTEVHQFVFLWNSPGKVGQPPDTIASLLNEIF
jgi:hypothetical protein